MSEEKPSIGHTAPPGLLGACMLFWGWQVDLLLIIVPLALLVEGYRFLSWRWTVTDVMMTRTWTFCLILFLGLIFLASMREEGARAIYFAMSCLPLVILPILLVQLYSTRDGVPLRAMSLLARYADKVTRRTEANEAAMIVNLEMPYAVIALVAASTANSPRPDFYICSALLIGYGLLVNPLKPRRRLTSWGTAFAAVMMIGYFGYIGLHKLHLFVEQKAIDAAMNRDNVDPDKSVTHIGKIGELKQSGRVLWRVEEVHGRAPAYLRQASYNAFRRGTWFNVGKRDFLALQRLGSKDVPDWRLNAPESGHVRGRLKISGNGRGEYAHLSLPETTLTVEGIEGGLLSRNPLAVTRLRDPEKRLIFHTDYEHGLHGDPAWDGNTSDLNVPLEERISVLPIVQQLRLDYRDFNGSLSRLSDWFRDGFSYTLEANISHRTKEGKKTPLARFLYEKKSGHCEYFATATVLLLRQAGIPARYVTGYSVQEYDEEDDLYVLRGIHAHAWAQAWDGKEWVYIDNTPAVWIDQDQDAISWNQSWLDWLDNMPFAFENWKMTAVGQTVLAVLKWGTFPALLLYIVMRVFRGQASERVNVRRGMTRLVDCHGLDSEWFDAEQALSVLTRPRRDSETAAQWLSAIMKDFDLPDDWGLNQILLLHYRLRFDPDGLSKSDRQELARCSEELRDRIKARQIAS